MASNKPLSERTSPASGWGFGMADWAIAGLLSIIALAVYVRTLAPDVLFGDGGEFQVLGATLGLAHTTGYPIYILLAKLATLLPFGTIAYRVNLFSAFMGAISVGELFLLARTLDVRRVYAAIGALALLVSPLFWWQSVIAKPHVITAPLLITLLICTIVWNRYRDSRLLFAAGGLGALCLGLHHIVLLTLPAVLAYLFFSKASKSDWKMAATGVLLGAGISFLAYMAMASIENVTTATNSIRPSLTGYGMRPEAFDSPFGRASFEFFSKQYGNQLLSFDVTKFSDNVTRFFHELYRDFGVLPGIIALIGAGSLFRKSWRDAALILGSMALMLVFAVKFTIFDLEEHFVLPYLLIALCVALGFQAIQDLTLKHVADNIAIRVGSGAVAAAALLIGNFRIWRGGLLALQEASPTFLTSDQRRVPFPVDQPDTPHEIGEFLVSMVPDGALILTTWDYEWPCYYVAQFEANKPNISVVELIPQGSFTPGGTPSLPTSMQQFIEESLAIRPVFETQRHPILLAAYDQIPLIPEDSKGNGMFRILPRRSR